MPAILELSGLTRRYAGLVAVDGVNLSVNPGTIHAIIGPNGAGKTTLFNLISGITPRARGGSISLAAALPPNRPTAAPHSAWAAPSRTSASLPP